MVAHLSADGGERLNQVYRLGLALLGWDEIFVFRVLYINRFIDGFSYNYDFPI